MRAVASAAHPAPRYFPDEYIYTAIARALGSGAAPSVRGEPARFPALLEPVLAAPFHALFSPESAYRLTQFENALFMSLAAVPVYLLARRLALSAPYALACALFTVALPDLVFSSYTLAEPVAFPLALAALYAGVIAVERPSRRAQFAFLGFALLATLARVQFVVLPAAFLVAALLVDRKRVLRTQRLPLALFALPLLGALAVGPSHVLGYYSTVAHQHLGTQLAHWAVLDVFLLVLASGAVPSRARWSRSRVRRDWHRDRVRAARGDVRRGPALRGGALRVERQRRGSRSATSSRCYRWFRSRSGSTSSTGAPAACRSRCSPSCCSRRPPAGRSRPTRPASGWTDSPFLSAVYRLEGLVGTGNGSLIVALLAAAAAAGAVLVSRRGGAEYALARGDRARARQLARRHGRRRGDCPSGAQRLPAGRRVVGRLDGRCRT